MRRESLGRAFASRTSRQWFHAASADLAPANALIVERYLISGKVVLRLLPADGGGFVRDAKAYFEPSLNPGPD